MSTDIATATATTAAAAAFKTGGTATANTATTATAASVNLPSSTETKGPASVAKNVAIQRRVARLLDISFSSELKELAAYVDEVVPGYFVSTAADGTDSKDAELSTSAMQVRPSTGGGVVAAAASQPSAAVLRTALNGRVAVMHRQFLQEFSTVYSDYERVASQVDQLQHQCTSLEAALLAGKESGIASEAEQFLHRMQVAQAELQLIKSHERDVLEFKKKFNFGPAEQRVLEEGPVDVAFLNVLERAREVHRHSCDLMQSSEYHQGAAAVMESTYAAMVRATEKIARFLIAAAASTSTSASASGTTSTGGGSHAVGYIAGDTPEISSFQLRCMRILYEDSPSYHAMVLDEMARLRRASVLRRYFHLLSTGSANTSTGTYQRDGDKQVTSTSSKNSSVLLDSTGVRPLEAELANPNFFFSSLCAWLHQSIVEEEDFFALLFKKIDDDGVVGRAGEPSPRPHGGSKSAVDTDAEMEKAAADIAHRQRLLDYIFGGVCKHIQGALDYILERLSRSTSVLDAGEGVAALPPHHVTPSAPSNTTQLQPRSSQLGPRGLTGGLTRLFMAATGRRMNAAPGGQGHADGAPALLQRYATVTTRAQQSVVAAQLLQPLLHAVETCATLIQLLGYYSAVTFYPLLGPDAALSQLIGVTAPVRVREVFQRLLKTTAAHLYDSPVGVVSRTTILHRLASSNAMAAVSTDFVLNFITAHDYNEATEHDLEKPSSVALLSTSGTASLSNSVSFEAAARLRNISEDQLQHHNAQNLHRALGQLILPISPEVEMFCSLLKTTMADTVRQMELLHTIAEQRATTAEEGMKERCDDVRQIVIDLLDVLMDAAASMSENAILRENLDEFCRILMEYSLIYTLHQIMEEYKALLDGLAAPLKDESDSAETATTRAAASRIAALRTDTEATLCQLGKKAMQHWVDAATRHYFCVSVKDIEESVGTAAAGDDGGLVRRRQMHRFVKQMVNFYNDIASFGRLPEPIPLTESLPDVKLVQAISRAATQHLVEVVYPLHYATLRGLPSFDELLTVQQDMSPSNLLLLLDRQTA